MKHVHAKLSVCGETVGQFDHLPAENFGNLKPLPDGYAVVWLAQSGTFLGTKRGTDLELWDGWNRYMARKCCFAHAESKKG